MRSIGRCGLSDIASMPTEAKIENFVPNRRKFE